MKFDSIYFILIFLSEILVSCANTGSKESKNVSSGTAFDKHAETTGRTHGIDKESFEILATDHNPSVENFHILLKTGKYDKFTLQDFVDRFRQEYCDMQCNVSIYDDISVKSLVTKYPLEDKEYLKMADHFVAASTFDMTEVWLYPYQDIKYKELGGNNWKKEKMK